MLGSLREKLNELRKNPDEELPDIWEILKQRKAKGLWDGEIETIEIKSTNLKKGDHYFVIENMRQRSIVCLSCNQKHGGILEARNLHRYKLENGVLYLDGKPTNTTPKGFKPEA